MRIAITEGWLTEIGFLWHQFDRQPAKHWLLWLGAALMDCSAHDGERRMFCGYEDLGIEVANDGPFWFCWLRSDSAGRYHRFIHVRHLVYQDELIDLIQALTGRHFAAEDVMHGSLRTAADAAQLRLQQERLDVRLNQNRAWLKHEEDQTRGRPLPEHVEAAIKGGLAK